MEYLGEADEGARFTFAITALAVPEMANAARWLADVAGCAAITENTRPRWRRPARANCGRGFPVATMGSVPKAVCRTYNAVYRVLEIPCQLALARVIVRRTVGAACTLGFSKRGLARYEF